MAEESANTPISVREAMDQVLAAEREAQSRLEACRAEAEQIQLQALDRARHIQETAERRIGHIQLLCQQASAARIRELRRETARKSAVIDTAPTRSAAVEKAVAALAGRLTGGVDDDE